MSHSLCFIICDWLVWSRVSQGRHESGSISRFLLSVEERSQPCWGISFYIAKCGELCISCFNTTCYREGWPNRYKKPQEMWLDCYTRRITIEKTYPVWYPEHQAHPTSRPACRTAKSYRLRSMVSWKRCGSGFRRWPVLNNQFHNKKRTIFGHVWGQSSKQTLVKWNDLRSRCGRVLLFLF